MTRRTNVRTVVRAAWLPASLCALAVMAPIFLSGNNGCGTTEQKETLESPVQALGTIYQHPDGVVEAELVLISTIGKTHVFIDTATSVELVVDGTTIIPLPKDTTRAGRWAITSSQQPALRHEASTRYLFRFELDDSRVAGKMAGEQFTGEVTANTSPSTVTPVSAGYVGHTLDVTFSPKIASDERGVLLVYGPDGEVTYRNFDLRQPQFDGSKHARLIIGLEHTIPGTAFPEPGDYRIVLYTMRYVSGFDPHKSSKLGVVSGFMAGAASEASVNVE